MLALVSLMIIDMYMYPLNVSNFYCVILYIRTSYWEIVKKGFFSVTSSRLEMWRWEGVV